jgi:tRNA 2-selenouridine synthase
LPGAVNWPVLSNDERRIVGTLYVQTSPLAARKLGSAMVARNVAQHIDTWVQDKPREWQPLVYCWRGGQRSGTMAWFLDQIGFRTTRLAGGYKGFRAVVRDDLASLPQRFQLQVLAGRTGSGKTRLLQALAEQGAQILDLEALAHHRGSILGGVPGDPQPSQKRFDTQLWTALQRLDAARPVFVESESKKIGRLQVPDSLVQHMREQGTVLRVEMPEAARVQLLLQEYGFFADDVERFCGLLDGLIELRGRERVGRWQAQARAGDWATLFTELMREHYDPLYLRSMVSHFDGYSQAQAIELADGERASVQAVAAQLLQSLR